MADDRTEQASQHRREKARKDGDILHSRELSSAAGTLAGVGEWLKVHCYGLQAALGRYDGATQTALRVGALATLALMAAAFAVLVRRRRAAP